MGVDIKASRFFDILAVAAMLLLFLGYSSNQKSAIAGGWQLTILLIIAFLLYSAIKSKPWK
ncbi:MAG TPA: hypothetical protein ENF50_05095 [Archaeoglobus veneficus]|nr:hypothetical protein [Archaeoglobus veneficus]